MLGLGEPDDRGIYPATAKQAVSFEPVPMVALVDADLLDGGTRHPNLAVMKMSAYFKEMGSDVRLVEDVGLELGLLGYSAAMAYDAIYISKVFDFTKVDRRLVELPNVFVGGTGFFFDHAEPLPPYIEHQMPDYHVYDSFIAHDKKHVGQRGYWKDYQDFSIGFATRGCFRQCKFCVNQQYRKVVRHSYVSEWFDPSRKYIYLWDDNIFGYPRWQDVFAELRCTGKPFKFRQGMDIRLMTEVKARALEDAKLYKDVIFAFDHPKDAPIIEKKLKLWRSHSDKQTKLYVLCGFESQDEREVESVFMRIQILFRYRCFPYVMKHELCQTSRFRGMFTYIACWANQPHIVRKMSFREFCERSQQYVKSDGLCAALRAMRDFEREFPDIAKTYFDMKFDGRKDQAK